MKSREVSRKSRNLWRIFPLILALLIVAAMLPSCQGGKTLQEWAGAEEEEGQEEGLAPVSGEFVTGPEVELVRTTVPATGGTVEVDKPGDPLDGLTIEVPAGTYADDRTFVVSSATIESHTFAPPLIR